MCRKFYASLLPIFFVIPILLTGCPGSSDDPPKDNGKPPTIDTVTLYRMVNDNWIEAQEILIGEGARFAIDLTDPDKDIITLMIESYYPSDSNVPYYDPIEIAMPSQPNVSNTFTVNVESWSSPAGGWRDEIYLIDAKGNESNTWTHYYSVSEP